MTQLKGKKLIGIGATVFWVLAWVALVLQVGMGIVLLIMGGDAVPLGGVDIPARLVGALNLVAAVVYWFMFLLASAVLRLLMDIHCQVTKGSGTACSA